MWYFTSPQIIYGEDALDALDELKGQRAMLVTDKIVVKIGLAKLVQSHLKKAGIETFIYDEVEPEPTVMTVKIGAQAALEYNPDWVIGLGGGSAIDAAKGIWCLYEHPEMEPEEFNPINQFKLRQKAHLIAIPTTSGTGSEATWFFILSDKASHRKIDLGNREIIADLAIVDPKLASSMPKNLTADTGLDALTHAIEAFTGTWHTDLTDGLCINAILLIFEYLQRAVTDGTDMEARERLANAATCGGLGFGNAMASVAHSMGHAIGSVFHVPHGRAVIICLPYTIEFAAHAEPQRFAMLARILGCPPEDDEAAARELARRVRELCQEVGVPTNLADVGVEKDIFEAQLEKLVEDAFNDTQIVTAVRSPDFAEMRRLFECVYEGRLVDF